MDCSTDGVVLERLHLEALVDDSLTSNGGIPVDNDGDDLLSVLLLSTEEMLLSAASAHHAGVNSFQMGGVSHQRELDLVSSITVASTEGCSKMVLDVTSLGVDSLSTLLWLNTLELGHDCLHGLAHDVGESVETASVRHSDHEGAGTLFDGGVNAELEAWNERFAALETEALHGVEFHCHEGTPLMGPVQAHVQVDALGLGRVAELNSLELFADPVALFFVLNVHKLNANFLAVSLAVSSN
jgi:hypothetical protein